MSSDKTEPENPDFSLTLSEDLLAAAVEAAEKRFSKKPDDEPLDVEFDEGTIDEDEVALDVDLSVDLDLDDPQLSADPELAGAAPADELLQLNTELIARVAELEAEGEELAEQVAQRDAQIESLRSTAGKLQEQVKRAKELNLKMSVRSNRLRDTQERLKLRYEDAQAKVRALEDLVAQARTQVRVSEDERERTRLRHVRELEELRTFGTEGFFKELLPVLDHLDLAMSHADDTSPERMVEGVRMIFAQLGNTLRRMGLTTIDPAPGAAFDPNQHDAMKNQVHPTIAQGHIIDVLQQGYAIGDRLIRAARVSVSGGPDEAPVSPSDEVLDGDAASAGASDTASEE